MKKHLKTLSSLLLMVIMLVLPYLVFGQNITSEASLITNLRNTAQTGGYVTDTTNSGLTIITGLIVQTTLGLLGAIFIILMVYAGYTWMTASGNETKIEKARSMIQTAIIGLIIVLSSWAIWAFIFTNFIGN